MNVLDLTILGAVGLIALIGLKFGMLKPVSGGGSFIIGAILASQYYSAMALVFARITESPTIQMVAGFVSTILIVIVLIKLIAWLIQKVLARLFLQWMDHVAGAFGGAALGILITGTLVYMLGGVNMAPARDALGTSVLAPQISQASLLAPSKPWCSTLSNSGSANGCRDLKGFAGNMFGSDVDEELTGVLGGHEVGEIVEMVKNSLNGGTSEQVAKMSRLTQEENDPTK